MTCQFIPVKQPSCPVVVFVMGQTCTWGRRPVSRCVDSQTVN